MLNRKFLLLMLLSCVLLVLGVLYVTRGIQLVTDVDVLASNIEKSQLYFELGFNSTASWKKSYLFDAYVRLAGGVVIFIVGLFLIIKYRPVTSKVID